MDDVFFAQGIASRCVKSENRCWFVGTVGRFCEFALSNTAHRPSVMRQILELTILMIETAANGIQKPMKAITYAKYGSLEVLEVKELGKSVSMADEVLIRVQPAECLNLTLVY